MKKTSLANKILIALILGLIFGIVANTLFPEALNSTLSKWVLVPIGNIFLRGIKLIVVPLVLFSLIVGTASLGDIRKLGRIGGKIITYYLATTALAITIAIILAKITNPGIGLNLPKPTEFKATQPPFIMDIFVNMVPTNPFDSLVKGEMLQVIVFSILFGISITLVGEKAKGLLNLIEQANEVCLKLIGVVMLFAPYGVFALISNVIMSQGIKVILPLLKYGFTVLFALLLQLILVYGTALTVIGRVNPITFFKKFWTVMVVAFSTSSSNATLPVTLKTCEEKLGIPESIASFTIPLGATINMDGTAIMQGVATIFIAQIFGIDLTVKQLLIVVLTATLASIGTAGVPSAGIVMLTMVLQQIGVPVEGIALIIPIDRILDMCRTVVNVTGDAVGTTIVANSEKELDITTYNTLNV
ncbi:dicarboxylate/amino acid:cation symporter [Thermobrachium celere]|uniref:Proton/glutamate symport protein @ Sodium/glutamate symport protein n=3 Tax=Thermobrachium TaxID=150333 RepID=R7RV60_9CLOT|nr:dicarboxylate/amino acid:cation symporter [Thermobrachium celere]CDF59435.1 Proton/glutamate symport protein @ Sodium/glutamate symport protein [Thermobrachium celere DSM 8682]